MDILIKARYTWQQQQFNSNGHQNAIDNTTADISTLQAPYTDLSTSAKGMYITWQYALLCYRATGVT